MDAHSLEITRHARDRFIARWPDEPPACYWSELVRLLSVAVEEFLGCGTAIRIIQNGFQPARYFTAEGWRFVTDEDVTKLLTCERVLIRGRKPLKKMRSKKKTWAK